MEAFYPDRVEVGEEFNVTALMKYDFGNSSIPLKLLVRGGSGEVLAESEAVKVSGNGSLRLAARIKAPDEEEDLTLMLIPAYYDENKWLEVSGQSVSLNVAVEKTQLNQTFTERTVIRKQVVFVTVTQTVTVRERMLTTYTITRRVSSSNIREMLIPVTILTCSSLLLALAIITFLKGRRLKRSRRPE